MRGSLSPAKYDEGSGPSSRISHSKSCTLCAVTMACWARSNAWRWKVGVMMVTAGGIFPSLSVARGGRQAFGDEARNRINMAAEGVRAHVPHPHLAPVIGRAHIQHRGGVVDLAM